MLMWIRSRVSVEISLRLHLIVSAHTCKCESIFHAFTCCTNPQTGVTLPTHMYTRTAWQQIMYAFFWALLNVNKLPRGAVKDLSHNKNIHNRVCSLGAASSLSICVNTLNVTGLVPAANMLSCLFLLYAKKKKKKIKCEKTDDLPHLHWNILAEIYYY